MGYSSLFNTSITPSSRHGSMFNGDFETNHYKNNYAPLILSRHGSMFNGDFETSAGNTHSQCYTRRRHGSMFNGDFETLIQTKQALPLYLASTWEYV